MAERKPAKFVQIAQFRSGLVALDASGKVWMYRDYRYPREGGGWDDMYSERFQPKRKRASKP